MKKFKIIKVKCHQVVQPNGIVVKVQWEKQRDITSEESALLRVSETGVVQRLQIRLETSWDLMKGIAFKATWLRDDDYRVVWQKELEGDLSNEDPWKVFISRFNQRSKKNFVDLGQTI